MIEYEASRTLVKSPPELWAELSDQVSLAGHLTEPFGEIRITRLEPETAVAWEGERASGTVRIEPAGWGTRVTLTARAVQGDHHKTQGRPQPTAPKPAPLPRPAPPEPLPPAAVEPARPAAAQTARRGLRGLLFGWLKARPEPPLDEPPPTKSEDDTRTRAAAPPVAKPASVADEATSADLPATAEATSATAIDPDAVLVSVLDRLGAAHHRPFSRS